MAVTKARAHTHTHTHTHTYTHTLLARLVSLGHYFFNVHHRWGTGYSREGTIQETVLFFNAGTFASSSIKKKQRKTEPGVYCKLLRLNKSGNKNSELDPETIWAGLQTRGGGGLVAHKNKSPPWHKIYPKLHSTGSFKVHAGGGHGE